MSKIPTNVTGKALVKALQKHLGYAQTRQKGSHVRMTLRVPDGENHVTVPMHSPIKVGTLRGILSDLAFFHKMDLGDILGTLDL